MWRSRAMKRLEKDLAELRDYVHHVTDVLGERINKADGWRSALGTHSNAIADQARALGRLKPCEGCATVVCVDTDAERTISDPYKMREDVVTCRRCRPSLLRAAVRKARPK